MIGAAGPPLATTGRTALAPRTASKDDPGRGRDRHANIGTGTIDPELLVAEATFALARYQIEDPSFHPYDSKCDAWLEGRARFSAKTPAKATPLMTFVVLIFPHLVPSGLKTSTPVLVAT